MPSWKITYLNDNGWAIGPAETFEGTRKEAENHAYHNHPMGFSSSRYRLTDVTVRCHACGDTKLDPNEPQPDSFGVYTPCEVCEDADH